MLKLNKEILTRLYMKDLRASYPTFPTYALPERKYSDTTANGLTKCIKEFLNFTGHQAERINSMGRQIDNTKVVEDVLGRKRTIGSKKYIPGTATNGTADISSTIYGMSVKIEVKIGKDVQSADQKKYQKSVEDAGGIYTIAKDFDGFIEFYRDLVFKDKAVLTSQLGREFVVVSEAQRKIQFIDNLEVLLLTEKQFSRL